MTAAEREIAARAADGRRWQEHLNRLVWPPARVDPCLHEEGIAKAQYVLGRRLDEDPARG